METTEPVTAPEPSAVEAEPSSAETESNSVDTAPSSAGAQPYVFGKPPELDDNAVREVRALFEKFGVLLSELWSAEMRTAVEVEIGEIGRIPAEGVAEWVAEGSGITVGHFPPMLGNAALVIPVNLALNMVDLLLGGNGLWSPPERQLTELEIAMMHPLTERMLAVLGESLSGAGPHARVTASGTDPKELELESTLGDIVGVEIKIKHNSHEMLLHVGVSMDLAASLVSELSESLEELDTSPSRELLSRKLVEVEIELAVRFPPVKVRSAELLQLSPGDLLHLDCRTDEPLLLTSNGKTLGAVRPAHNGDTLAIQVVAFPYHGRSPGRTSLRPEELNLGAL